LEKFPPAEKYFSGFIRHFSARSVAVVSGPAGAIFMGPPEHFFVAIFLAQRATIRRRHRINRGAALRRRIQCGCECIRLVPRVENGMTDRRLCRLLPSVALR